MCFLVTGAWTRRDLLVSGRVNQYGQIMTQICKFPSFTGFPNLKPHPLENSHLSLGMRWWKVSFKSRSPSDLQGCGEKKSREGLGFVKWVFPKIMVPPNHPFVHRVFHYFHHPFWGVFPLFLVQHPKCLWFLLTLVVTESTFEDVFFSVFLIKKWVRF